MSLAWRRILVTWCSSLGQRNNIHRHDMLRSGAQAEMRLFLRTACSGRSNLQYCPEFLAAQCSYCVQNTARCVSRNMITHAKSRAKQGRQSHRYQRCLALDSAIQRRQCNIRPTQAFLRATACFDKETSSTANRSAIINLAKGR